MIRARPLRAFTLVEVMIVVAIAGIMAALSVVSLLDVVNTNIENGSARSLAAVIKRGRVQAISNHARVSVTVAGNVVQLKTCRAVYGGNGTCANNSAGTAETLTNLAQGSFNFGSTDTKGVTVTGPSEGIPLIFDAAGFPETSTTTYTYLVDHPKRPGNRTVVVTAAGEVRVQ